MQWFSSRLYPFRVVGGSDMVLIRLRAGRETFCCCCWPFEPTRYNPEDSIPPSKDKGSQPQISTRTIVHRKACCIAGGVSVSVSRREARSVWLGTHHCTRGSGLQTPFLRMNLHPTAHLAAAPTPLASMVLEILYLVLVTHVVFAVLTPTPDTLNARHCRSSGWKSRFCLCMASVTGRVSLAKIFGRS